MGLLEELSRPPRTGEHQIEEVSLTPSHGFALQVAKRKPESACARGPFLRPIVCRWALYTRKKGVLARRPRQPGLRVTASYTRKAEMPARCVPTRQQGVGNGRRAVARAGVPPPDLPQGRAVASAMMAWQNSVVLYDTGWRR